MVEAVSSLQRDRLVASEPLDVDRSMRKMVKQRSSDSVRTYDDEGYVLRAACVCVRDCKENEVLLVSGGRNSERWIVPGGGIEPSEEAWTAALREVKEEAGVIGTLDRCLGVFETCKSRTCVFVLVVDDLMDVWEESESIGRKRKWFSLEEARLELSQHRPAHCMYLDHLMPSSSNQSRHSSLIHDSAPNTSIKNL